MASNQFSEVLLSGASDGVTPASARVALTPPPGTRLVAFVCWNNNAAVFAFIAANFGYVSGGAFVAYGSASSATAEGVSFVVAQDSVAIQPLAALPAGNRMRTVVVWSSSKGSVVAPRRPGALTEQFISAASNGTPASTRIAIASAPPWARNVTFVAWNADAAVFAFIAANMGLVRTAAYVVAGFVSSATASGSMQLATQSSLAIQPVAGLPAGNRMYAVLVWSP